LEAGSVLGSMLLSSKITAIASSFVSLAGV